MTDEQIIKAYELCHSDVLCDETNCPFFAKCKTEDLSRYILDLINRQKAEIEHLKSATNCYRAYEEEQKAEAIKEFAERLKDLKHECGCNYRKKPVFAVTEDKIDNLVKEMVGEGNV